MSKSNVKYNRISNFDNKSLIEIYQQLKSNTAIWARWWVLNDTPTEIHVNEHHIITEALVSFRDRYRNSSEDECAELVEFLQ
jgi:hypothetical protein